MRDTAGGIVTDRETTVLAAGATGGGAGVAAASGKLVVVVDADGGDDVGGSDVTGASARGDAIVEPGRGDGPLPEQRGELHGPRHVGNRLCGASGGQMAPRCGRGAWRLPAMASTG